jgi:LysM repeat protein
MRRKHQIRKSKKVTRITRLTLTFKNKWLRGGMNGGKTKKEFCFSMNKCWYHTSRTLERGLSLNTMTHQSQATPESIAPFDKSQETISGQQYDEMYRPMYKDARYAKGQKPKPKQRQHPSFLTKYQILTGDTYQQILSGHYQNQKDKM